MKAHSGRESITVCYHVLCVLLLLLFLFFVIYLLAVPKSQNK